MNKDNQVVFGIYKTRTAAESSIQQLKLSGFRVEDLSVLMPDQSVSRDLAAVEENRTSEGIATGAGTGALLGGALGWLIGAGVLALTGFAPLLAAGPIVAALAGAGVGGTVGGLAGGLIGMGIPENEAKRYEGRVKDGGILLSVHADDSNWAEKAEVILERTGAEDVATAADEKVSHRLDTPTGSEQERELNY